ncbi:related to YJU2 - Essential nuclear protein, putative spliceosomal component [Melanopsichium pennsylvanicum]|uniref:Splicing factor YJU2 n=2 Tax=Melanopsichium pennsylvanicum TaxID=63383 RepID=A0AAJ5C718_9BASI|nr:related to YJU2-Essential nuclear protein, putative spliceosomal component [Melanopsichium pennsylvanicum 4]SNX86447.1 related to YJU2 - Essential nuclear protein, putative spliceosomal component [Melanopsichium pennsylvanicum]
MADRKALNHYYPPDFDPSKIPRRKAPKDAQQTVRLMAPFSMRCNSCGEYIYKGKKFNARKELVVGEDYYGIKIFRFYIRCTQCSAEITFKTDPKNADYQAEHGASRNFVPTKDEEKGEEEEDNLQTEEEKLEKKLEKMEGDPMKQLEARTLDSRREMEILDALQDIRTRNARLERVDTDVVLARLHSKDIGPSAKGVLTEKSLEDEEQKKAEEEDEVLVRKYFGKALDVSGSSANGVTVKRKLDEEAEAEPDVHTLLAMKAAATAVATASSVTPSTAPAPAPASAAKKKKNAPNAFGLVRKHK